MTAVERRERFSRALRDWRDTKADGVNAKAARLLGVSPQFFGDICAGRTEPDALGAAISTQIIQRTGLSAEALGFMEPAAAGDPLPAGGGGPGLPPADRAGAASPVSEPPGEADRPAAARDFSPGGRAVAGPVAAWFEVPGVVVCQLGDLTLRLGLDAGEALASRVQAAVRDGRRAHVLAEG